MVGSVLMASRSEARGIFVIFLIGMTLMAALTAVVVNSTSFALTFAAIMGIGFGASLAANGAQTTIQSASEGPMRGRVMSLYTLNFRAFPAVGALAIGGAAELLNLPLVMTVTAAVTGIVILVLVLRRHRIASEVEAVTGSGA